MADIKYTKEQINSAEHFMSTGHERLEEAKKTDMNQNVGGKYANVFMYNDGKVSIIFYKNKDDAEDSYNKSKNTSSFKKGAKGKLPKMTLKQVVDKYAKDWGVKTKDINVIEN